MIDLQHLQAEIIMKEGYRSLEQHPYSIWQGKKDNKFYTYLPDQTKKRILVKRNTKEEIHNVVIQYWKEKEVNPTLQEVFDEWNDRKLNLEKISPSTHIRNIQTFNRHYSAVHDKRIKSITPEWIEDFLEEQIPKHNLTAKAFGNLKTITRGFLKRAKKRKLIDFRIEDILSDIDISSFKFR